MRGCGPAAMTQHRSPPPTAVSPCGAERNCRGGPGSDQERAEPGLGLDPEEANRTEKNKNHNRFLKTTGVQNSHMFNYILALVLIYEALFIVCSGQK